MVGGIPRRFFKSVVAVTGFLLPRVLGGSFCFQDKGFYRLGEW